MAESNYCFHLSNTTRLFQLDHISTVSACATKLVLNIA